MLHIIIFTLYIQTYSWDRTVEFTRRVRRKALADVHEGRWSELVESPMCTAASELQVEISNQLALLERGRVVQPSHITYPDPQAPISQVGMNISQHIIGTLASQLGILGSAHAMGNDMVMGLLGQLFKQNEQLSKQNELILRGMLQGNQTGAPSGSNQDAVTVLNLPMPARTIVPIHPPPKLSNILKRKRVLQQVFI